MSFSGFYSISLIHLLSFFVNSRQDTFVAICFTVFLGFFYILIFRVVKPYDKHTPSWVSWRQWTRTSRWRTSTAPAVSDTRTAVARPARAGSRSGENTPTRTARRAACWTVRTSTSLADMSWSATGAAATSGGWLRFATSTTTTTTRRKCLSTVASLWWPCAREPDERGTLLSEVHEHTRVLSRTI